MPKATSPIPAGFHSLTPHLTVNGAAAFMEFLKKAFNAVEIDRAPGPGGKLIHATAKIGDSLLMFADDLSEEFHLPPVVRGNLPVHLHVYVPDADATFAQAVAAGAQVKMPISDQFWGDRYGHLVDPFGFQWAIASRKEDLTREELQQRAAKAFGSHS